MSIIDKRANHSEVHWFSDHEDGGAAGGRNEGVGAGTEEGRAYLEKERLLTKHRRIFQGS